MVEEAQCAEKSSVRVPQQSSSRVLTDQQEAGKVLKAEPSSSLDKSFSAVVSNNLYWTLQMPGTSRLYYSNLRHATLYNLAEFASLSAGTILDFPIMVQWFQPKQSYSDFLNLDFSPQPKSNHDLKIWDEKYEIVFHLIGVISRVRGDGRRNRKCTGAGSLGKTRSVLNCQ